MSLKTVLKRLNLSHLENNLPELNKALDKLLIKHAPRSCMEPQDNSSRPEQQLNTVENIDNSDHTGTSDNPTNEANKIMTNATKRDFPWDVRGAFDKIVGKQIKGVVIKEAYPSPDAQIFILFADNTYFEIYGGEMHGAKDVYKGGLEEVKSYMAGKGRGITFERVDESIKDTDISNSTVHHADECDSTHMGSPTLIKKLMLRSMQPELSLKTIKSAIPSEEDLLIIYDDLVVITESLAQQLPGSAKTQLYSVKLFVQSLDESSLDLKNEILTSLHEINEKLIHSNITDAAVLLSNLRSRVKDLIEENKEDSFCSLRNETKPMVEVEPQNRQNVMPALGTLASKNEEKDSKEQPINKSTGSDIWIALTILAGLTMFWALPFVIFKKKIDFVWPGLFNAIPGH